jgi:NAD-dependent dihydropyrimidine dehydrogenase PreA subunit
MATLINQETCTGCGECVDACPLESIEIKDDKAVVDEETCGDCGSCVDVCPVEAISMD